MDNVFHQNLILTWLNSNLKLNVLKCHCISRLMPGLCYVLAFTIGTINVTSAVTVKPCKKPLQVQCFYIDGMNNTVLPANKAISTPGYWKIGEVMCHPAAGISAAMDAACAALTPGNWPEFHSTWFASSSNYEEWNFHISKEACNDMGAGQYDSTNMLCFKKDKYEQSAPSHSLGDMNRPIQKHSGFKLGPPKK